MTSEPPQKRPSFWTRVGQAIFGKPLTNEQMAAQRADPTARASQSSHSISNWMGGGGGSGL